MKDNINMTEEVQVHRLIAFANFLHGIKMSFPVDKAEGFVITKKENGYDCEHDNFTFTWVIGVLPLVFGKYWAYSGKENIILKADPSASTFKSIQNFFGLSKNEYFHLFVAYFQDVERFGGRLLQHDMTSGEDIAHNMRELAKKKVAIKTQLN